MAQPSIGAQASRLARDLTFGSSAASGIPKFVYGTAWKKENADELVYMALKAGFRAVDTAAQPKHYDERGVGAGVKRAIKDGIIKREDLFIQTKFSPPAAQNDDLPYDLNSPLVDQVHQSVKSSLANFTIDGQEAYLDSLVLHSPMDTMEETVTVWKTLETYTPHRIRNLGLSNTTLPVVKALHDMMTVTPTIVQNRFYNRTGYENKLREFCRQRQIAFQSFWTLTANGNFLRSSPVKAVAEGAGVSLAVAYYSLVLGLQGITILNGTTKEVHMKEDLEGIEKVGVWAEGEGEAIWEASISDFKRLIRET